jgi:hypothetical protein
VLEDAGLPDVRAMRAALRLRGERLGEGAGGEGAGHRLAETGQRGAAGHRGHGEATDEGEEAMTFWFVTAAFLVFAFLSYVILTWRDDA